MCNQGSVLIIFFFKMVAFKPQLVRKACTLEGTPHKGLSDFWNLNPFKVLLCLCCRIMYNDCRFNLGKSSLFDLISSFSDIICVEFLANDFHWASHSKTRILFDPSRSSKSKIFQQIFRSMNKFKLNFKGWKCSDRRGEGALFATVCSQPRYPKSNFWGSV